MKKLIFLLLTFMYSASFAGYYWYQTITVVNTTDTTFSQDATLGSGGQWDGNPSNELLPYSTNVIKAFAPDASEGGDCIFLDYYDVNDHDPNAGYIDAGFTSPQNFDCKFLDPIGLNTFYCSTVITDPNEADFKGTITIQYP